MRTLEERFWAKVDKSGDCWMWQASIGSHGYGQINLGPRAAGMALAHRLAYELTVRPIPSGYQVDHTCGERRCVNPSHLQLLDAAEHTSAGWERGQMRRSDASLAHDAGECLRGHDVTRAASIYVYPNGRRQCRECYNATRRAWRQRKAAC